MRLSYILDMLIYTIQTSAVRTLDTKRVDHHINELNKHSWFQEIYLDEKFRKLLLMNYKTRTFLDSTFFVKRLMKNPHAKEKFIRFLQKQLAKQSNPM